MLDPKYETYIVYVKSVSFVVSLSFFPFNAYLFCRPLIAGLIAKEALIKISNEYVNFADVFFPDLASELSEHNRINDYTIKLVDGQQLPYRPIYSLRPVELEILKAYIKTNLVNGFTKPSKSLASILILFDQKLDSFLRLYVNYRDLNNLMIMN